MVLLDFAAKRGFRTLPARVFFAALALTVTTYASVAEVPLNPAGMAFALLGGLSACYPIGALAVRRVQGRRSFCSLASRLCRVRLRRG